MPISENIRLLRESYSLSQAEFGEIAGVSDKAVSTWEKGIKVPRMGAVQRLADYFGIPKSEILDDRDKQFILSPDERRLINYYRESDDMHRAFAMEILKEHPKERSPSGRSPNRLRLEDNPQEEDRT